jgi:hypothetical protein
VKRSGIEGLGINFIEGLRLTKYKVQKSHIGGTYYVEPVNLFAGRKEISIIRRLPQKPSASSQ